MWEEFITCILLHVTPSSFRWRRIGKNLEGGAIVVGEMTVLVVELYRSGPSRGGGRRRGSRPRRISSARRREGVRGSSCTRRRVGERGGSCTRRREACGEALVPGGGEARGEAPPPGGGEVRGDAPAPDEVTDGGGGRAGGMARWRPVGEEWWLWIGGR